jgi:hypothetical protein
MGITKKTSYDEAERALDLAIEECRNDNITEDKAIDILLKNETVTTYFTKDEIQDIFNFELRHNPCAKSLTEH